MAIPAVRRVVHRPRESMTPSGKTAFEVAFKRSGVEVKRKGNGTRPEKDTGCF
jgi:hypothetical protein